MKILKLKDITTAKREPLEVNKKLAYLAQWHDPRFVKWINNQNIISFKAKVYMLFLLCQSVYLVAKGVLSPNGLKALLYTAHKTILIKDGMQWKIFSQRSSYTKCDVFNSSNSCSIGFQECIKLGFIKRVSSGEQSYAHAVDFQRLRFFLYSQGISTKFDTRFLEKVSKDYELNYETICRLFYENISNLLGSMSNSGIRITLFLFKKCILEQLWVHSSSFNELARDVNISCSAVIRNLQNLRNLQVIDIREGSGCKKNFVFAPGDNYLSENTKILSAGKAFKESEGNKKSSLEKAILSLNCPKNPDSWDFSDSKFIKLVQERGEHFYRNQSNLSVFGSTDNLDKKWDQGLEAYSYLEAASESQKDRALEIVSEWFCRAYAFTAPDDISKRNFYIKKALRGFIEANWYERKSIIYNLDKRISEEFNLGQVHVVSQVGYKLLCEIYLEKGLIVDNFSVIDENLSKLAEAHEYYRLKEEENKLKFLNKKVVKKSLSVVEYK